MKKVGREVLFIAAGKDNPRNGEGTFLRLRDGRIMYAYSKFTEDGWDDGCTADVVAIFSDDEGESWKNEHIIVKHTKDAINCMCPMLIRLKNDDIGIMVFRLIDKTNCTIFCFYRSSDEGLTWQGPAEFNMGEDDYYVIENDRLIMLSSGRIIMPANRHSNTVQPDGTVKPNNHGKMLFFASDDDGRSWYRVSEEYDLQYPEISKTGLQETATYEMKDGTIKALSRTDLLCQYESVSTDGGKNWSTPVPNVFFSSPDSPIIIKRLENDTVAAIFNPIPRYTTRKTGPNGSIDKEGNWGRTPLVLALSDDDGKTFDKLYYIEDDMSNGYCYPSIFDGGDYLLIGYYHSNDTGVPLNSNKIVKITCNELD